MYYLLLLVLVPCSENLEILNKQAESKQTKQNKNPTNYMDFSTDSKIFTMWLLCVRNEELLNKPYYLRYGSLILKAQA